MRFLLRPTVAVLTAFGLLGVPALTTALDATLDDRRTTAAALSRSPSATDPVEALRADLDAILDQPGVAEAHASVLVSTATGEVLYAREAGERLLPASNAKLFSSAAALEVLGPDHRFSTSVLVTGDRRGKELRGDIYLRGQGDPTLLADDLDRLAATVASTGVKRVRGSLVADDTWYDAVRLGNSWSWDDEPYYYSGQVSALTLSPNEDYDAGTVIVDVAPGARQGDPAQVTLVPATNYVTVVNKATTGATGDSSTIAVEREHGSNVVTVTGTIPVGAAADRSWTTVWEPTGLAADVFRAALARHGVRVTGPTKYAATPAAATVVATHESMPLRELLVPFLKLSNNGHAEVLVKEMGRATTDEGSWSAGLEAERAALAELGVDPDTLRLVDGSGLSRQDFVAPRQVVNLLVAARERPWFDTWYAALPIAGEPDRLVGGTLRSRMTGTAAAGNVHAKTGSLTAVSGLSGYVTSADGEPLVFSVLQNFYLGVNAKQIEDQIAVRLAQFSRTPAVQQPRGIPRIPLTDYGPAGVECSWVKAC